MNFEDLIRNRFSCRKFKNLEVSEDNVSKILDSARIAPSAKNNQPTFIYVIKTKEGIDKVDLVTPCRYNAPLVFLICSNKDIAFKKDCGYSTYEMDACIAGTHMLLECENLGLNSVWVEMFDSTNVKNVFELEDNLEPIFFLMVGYKEDGVDASPNHLNRKNIDEIVKYL